MMIDPSPHLICCAVPRQRAGLEDLARDLAGPTCAEPARSVDLEEVDLVEAVRGCLQERGWTDCVILDAPPVALAPIDLYLLDLSLVDLLRAAGASTSRSPAITVRIRAEAAHGFTIEIGDLGRVLSFPPHPARRS
jgi:hypothetical protein